MKLFDTSGFKKKLNPLLYKENDSDYLLKLKKAEQEVAEIFNEVTKDKVMSIYQLTLLQKKLLLIRSSLEETESYMEEYDNKVMSKVKYWTLLRTVNYLISVIMLFINPTVSYLLLFATAYFTFKILGCKENFLKQEDYDEVTIKKQGINNTITTSLGFINKKVKNSTMSQKNPEVTLQLLANHAIDVYFKSGELINVSEEVAECVVKTLQAELELDSTDVLILLDNARANINEKELEIVTRTRKNN